MGGTQNKILPYLSSTETESRIQTYKFSKARTTWLPLARVQKHRIKPVLCVRFDWFQTVDNWSLVAWQRQVWCSRGQVRSVGFTIGQQLLRRHKNHSVKISLNCYLIGRCYFPVVSWKVIPGHCVLSLDLTDWFELRSDGLVSRSLVQPRLKLLKGGIGVNWS